MKMKAFRDLFLICLINSFAKITSACNGYGVKLNSVTNCDDNNIIRADENFSVRLNNKCDIIPIGCATITKPFKTFDLKYTLKKPPLRTVVGKVDVCEICEVPVIASIIAAFRLPANCPVKAAKFCMNGSKKFNIHKYRTALVIASGDINLKLKGTHDTGTSCVRLDITIFRK